MLVLMDQVDFADREVPALEQLEFPHLATIEHMIQSCETIDIRGGRMDWKRP